MHNPIFGHINIKKRKIKEIYENYALKSYDIIPKIIIKLNIKTLKKDENEHHKH